MEEQHNYNFKVDLKGIIRLLSENLYSSSDVFLRELLQNAVDAIRARGHEADGFKDGRISIQYDVETKAQALLTFTDNGIGLTEQEIHSFLAVIGQSSKYGNLSRDNYIGQFGIGLLSCFLVADEITVTTCSIKESDGHRWIGYSDGTYRVQNKINDIECGTQVQLRFKDTMISKYNEQRIVELLKTYGFLIPVPIEFHGHDYCGALNEVYIPWRQRFASSDEILQFGAWLFEEEFLDVIPLVGEELKGYAFICGYSMNAAANSQHKIFLKNMLVTADGRDLIPKWAFFTKCIINANDLTPTASRESFVADHKLIKVRKEIEKSIYDYFVNLSQYNVDRLKQVTSIHNVAIKSLAIDNQRIYRLIFPFLTFPTNKGRMTGMQIVEKAKEAPIYYCAEVEEYRRVAALVGNSSKLLINAGYIYDSKLLQLMSKYYRSISLLLFDETAYEAMLMDPSPEIQRSMAALLEIAQNALQVNHCGVSVKKFETPHIQALYAAGTSDFFENTIYDSNFFENTIHDIDLFDPIADFTFMESEEVYPATLFLNCTNPLIQQLAQVHYPEMQATIIQILYIQAMMSGHYMLGEKELELVNISLAKLVAIGLSGKTTTDPE